MITERHRAIKFDSPFDAEFDPERELWVPNNRSRVFISAPKQPLWRALDLGTIEAFIKELTIEPLFQRQMLGSWDIETRALGSYDSIPDCAPPRGSLIVPPYRPPRRNYMDSLSNYRRF